MPGPLDLYLASTSPRRSQLLAQAGIRFELCAPGPEYEGGGSDHDHGETGDPATLAMVRARRKAWWANAADLELPVLGVDTVVDLDGKELGKPLDRAAAAEMLARLAGRTHRVHTAHCLALRKHGRSYESLSTAVVECRTPTPAELARYLDGGEWQGKAGSYGLQDGTQSFLTLVSGSFDTVVGLHVIAVRILLRSVQREPR